MIEKTESSFFIPEEVPGISPHYEKENRYIASFFERVKSR
jgi:hypothetical protein